MMLLDGLLRRMGILAPQEPKDLDDQIYSEAAMDNAIVDTGRNLDLLSRVAENGSRTNELLRAGIDRLKISGADPDAVVMPHRISSRR
jgi:hypothetical protein